MNRIRLKYSAGYMCYDSVTDRIYISSKTKTQRILDASGNQIGNLLNYGSGASLRLSEDGRYLALFDTERKLTILETSKPEHPVFSNIIGREFKIHKENNICFIDNNSLTFSIQHMIYNLQINPMPVLKIIYEGDPEKKPYANWKESGHIQSLSCNDQYIAALHYCFEPSTTYIVLINRNNLTPVLHCELPKDISNSYTDVCLTPNNGMCLFSKLHNRPMLYYSSVPSDFLQPDLMIALPPVYQPQFSKDGRFLTFSVTDISHPFGDAYLLNTNSWIVEETVRGNMVYSPSFSNDGKLWLVPGDVSYIIKL